MISRDQIRDGRRLLNWSAEELAKRVVIGRRTLQRIENVEGALEKTAFGTVMKIKAELENGGVEFLEDGSVKKRKSP